jgi:hypothetical protein
MIWDLTDTTCNNEPVPIQLRCISDLSGRGKEIHELIARRAYAIYEGRGHIPGHDVEDWLQAESEVVLPLCLGYMEENGDLRADIGIRKSELPQLQLCIEPFRLIVSGKRAEERPDQGCSEHSSEGPVQIFQAMDLPFQVEPAGAKATFANGLLEIRIPKAVKREKSVAANAA